ncbi:threonine/serine exporter family protein [uncultured Ilyobacter sp.]|uniref:threonine/serine ThrE exporter family protein n=1 Tax=uncultured Ilyobacter sp. TaxID=544433 RepID=UPI0029F480D3|nr:threonine/serine exporter family protein [uncultured Ilyobacter sp.]
MITDKILKLSTHAGKIILENGGETYRVENTVCKICEMYGYSADCFATLTGIMASLEDQDGNISSIIVRISKRGTNLDKIHRVNLLANEAYKQTPEEFMRSLKSIEIKKPYPMHLNFLAYAFCAASFSVIFGGSYRDFIVAMIIGGALNIFIRISNKLEINYFIINSVGGAICAVIGVFFVKIEVADNLDKIIIGSLMLLVPGLALTNAVRDIIAGDFMAGMARGVEALLIATSLAIGTGAVLTLML